MLGVGLDGCTGVWGGEEPREAGGWGGRAEEAPLLHQVGVGWGLLLGGGRDVQNGANKSVLEGWRWAGESHCCRPGVAAEDREARTWAFSRQDVAVVLQRCRCG